jgi:hypothetical protein
MYCRLTIGFFTIIIIALLYGCSGSGGPVASVGEDYATDLTSGSNGESSRTGNRFLLTYNLIYFDPTDPENIEIDYVPLRDAAIHLNILKFLEYGPCTDCFKIVGASVPTPGVIDIDIEITHPLDHPNFTVFDVRGIFMLDAGHTYPESGLIASDPYLGNGVLLNADGYTSLYNITTLGTAPEIQAYLKGKITSINPPNGTLNGYIRHWSDDPANTRNALYAASSDTRTYSVQLPAGPIIIGYAVDANWDAPVNNPVEDPMTDFDLDANSPEPWLIEVTGDPMGAWGMTYLTIDVYDWQGSTTHHEPVIECPEFFNGVKTAEWFEDGDGFSQWKVGFHNDFGVPPGYYMVLVSVEDNENDPVNEPWLDLTAYQVFDCEVTVQVYNPPTAVLEASKTTAKVGETIYFDATVSYDNDEGGEEIVEYLWDWNNDSVFLEGPGETTHSWTAIGTHYVQILITDDEMDIGMLDEPLEITIYF